MQPVLQWAEPRSERSEKSQIKGEAGLLLECLEVRDGLKGGGEGVECLSEERCEAPTPKTAWISRGGR